MAFGGFGTQGSGGFVGPPKTGGYGPGGVFKPMQLGGTSSVRGSIVGMKPGSQPPTGYPAPGGGGGGRGGRGGGGNWPTGPMGGPDLGKIEEDPEFARARARAEGTLGELDTGTGKAMELMQGNMQAQIDADVERMKEEAAQQGIPFDPAAARLTAQKNVQGALAAEKGRRDEFKVGAQAQLQNVIAGGAENKLAKGGLELGKYNTQAGIYGTNVGAETARYQTAMNLLSQFLGTLNVSV